MLKKYLAMLLAVALLTGGLSLPALAEETSEPAQEPQAIVMEEPSPEPTPVEVKEIPAPAEQQEAKETPQPEKQVAEETIPPAGTEAPAAAETEAPAETETEAPAEEQTAPEADKALPEAEAAAVEPAPEPEQTAPETPAPAAESETQTSGDFQFTVEGSTATVIRYTGTAAEVTLVTGLGGCAHTVVARGAFANCGFVKRVTVESGVSLADGALDGCAADAVVAGVPGGDIAVYAANSGLQYEEIKVDPTAVSVRSMTIGVGQVATLSVALTPENATTTLQYATSAKKVVAVNGSGVVKGVRVGTATIAVATSNGKKATCKIKVVKAPREIKLNVQAGTLGAGDSYKLSYALTKGTAATVTFISSNEAVATVDAQTGLVEAKQPGTATITARTHNGKKAACRVTVAEAPSGIDLNPAEIVVGKGQTAQLNASVNKGAAGRITYASGDESIAKVNANGTITGVNVGTTTITAGTYVEGVTATATVTVVPVPDKVSIVGSVKLGVGDRYLLEPVIPEGTMAAFSYESSKTKVATVSAYGVITAKRAGTATVVVRTSNGKKAACKVTVVKAPNEIKLNVKAGTLGAGDSYKLSYALTKGTAATVTFISSNEAVATVDAQTGLIEAKQPGTATITARTHNGKKAACRVTVAEAPSGIDLNPAEIVVGKGQTAQLNASVNKGAAGRITYASGDESIAKVNANGTITGVNVGTTTITAGTYVEGVTATATVTVVPVPDKVSVTGSVKLGVGDKFALEPVIPEGTMASFSYESSKSKVASVSGRGVITAKRTGTATITVKTSNGKKAACKVTVVKAPNEIKLNAKSGYLGAGDSYKLSYTLSKGTAATVTFTSSDESICRVDPHSGLLEALRAGTVVITAQTHNKKTARCTVTVYNAPEQILLSASELKLGAGQSAAITARVNDGAFGRIHFASSNPAVATVDANGRINAVSAGSAEIIATTHVEGVTASCAVTVCAAPGKVTLPEKLSIGAGDRVQLQPSVPDGTYASYTFASSNAKIAAVSADGVVVGKAKGTATIGVKTHNGKTATCKVTVTAAPTKISLDRITGRLGVGETLQLAAALTGGTAGSLRWFSSDEAIASVDAQTGLVTARGTGTATITASTYNNLQAVCQITVTPAPGSIAIEGAQERQLGVGQAAQLTATIPAESASAIIWSSSDTKVAQVDAGGKVTAKAAGTAVITASTYLADVSASVRVTVVPAPESVKLSVGTIELASFNTYQVVPVVASGSAASFSYQSSNGNVASVDASGLVTAYEPGTAVITVTSHNGKTAKLTVYVYDPNQPESILLGDMPDYLTIGATQQVEYTFIPSSAGKEMTWSSTDPAIATVSDTGLVTALSPGLATVVGVSRRNSSLKIEYGFIVLSEKRALTIPAPQTTVNDIAANMERIRAIEGSAYAEIYQQRLNGMITEAEYTRRIAIIKNAFSMLAFPWMTPTKEGYWSAANSEGGAKDFKPGVVYYGVPYTGNTSHRTYNTDKLLKEDYYTKAENADYYVWNTGKFTNRNYKGNDCSGFAGIAYYGTTSRGVGFSSTSMAKDSAFKTVSWSQPLRAGDLLVASGHHVAIFLYYVDAAKTQIMIIDQGGGSGSVNTVTTSIKKVSYYTSRGYIVRRLVGFAN